MNNKLKITLKLAGIYNMLWGWFVIMFPKALFYYADLPLPKYDMIWQSVGMIVGVYGVGYFLAARNYERHYLIVLVGFLGKVFGPIGIIYMTMFSGFSKVFLVVTFFNDLIWLIPFYLMLKEAYLAHQFQE